MELTESYLRVFPESVLGRYRVRETRNAAGILSVTNAAEFDELVQVLDGFMLQGEDLVNTGGNESKLAARLNDRFRALGWREGRVDTRVISELRVLPYRPAGEREPTLRYSEVFNEGYKVDNVKGRVALDVEWNAKDGNLDRDIGAYRALYDAGLIDCAVLITRTQSDLRPLAIDLARQSGLSDAEANKRLQTTTTTNLEKLQPRLTRGDAGGCPVLAVAISARSLGSTEVADTIVDPICSTRSALFDTDESGRMITG
ncbi:MAG TPA: BglII/BstYI family type II restriction endonuclease [Pseudonocardia sp.]|nr:BglII/BstYI family type II restriction endonuclease [Pseudonocardia sp.]